MSSGKISRRRSRWRFKLRISQSAEWLVSGFLIALDAILINLIFLGVFELWLSSIPEKKLYVAAYLDVRVLLFTIFLIFGFIFDMFRLRALKAVSDIFSHTVATLLSTFLTFNLLVFLYRPLAMQSHSFPRPIILLSTGLSILVTFFLRILVSRVFKTEPILLRAFIIGNEHEGRRILKHFHRRGGCRFKLLGIYPPEKIDEVATKVIFRHIHEVIITDPATPLDGFWASIFFHRKEEPHPFRVRVAYNPSSSMGNIDISSLEDFPMTTINSLPISRSGRGVKRTFDILFSLFALLITSPVMAFTAFVIKLDSPGPIFYKQRRVGRYGREFDLIKFRSMKVGAEAQSGPQIATSDDPRTTRVGKIIRRLGIDEFPQFFHVLTGEMSVVGPRPERPFFVKKHLEFQGRRLSVRPGVTGLAAVNARYYLRLTDKVGYDYFYLDHFNLVLDVKIVFQTIWVLLFESDKALEDKHHREDNFETFPENEPEQNRKENNTDESDNR